jgi:hypothetical protein
MAGRWELNTPSEQVSSRKVSGGGWNELPKAPTTSNLVIYIRASFILPHSELAMAAQNAARQRVLLRLRRQLLNMNREERKWKK